MQQQVKEWACSFSGCDGGNPNAPIWLCGIEWGLRVKDGESYYQKLAEQIMAGPIPLTQTQFPWADSLTYPYGLSFAKLYQVIQGQAIDSHQDVKLLSGDELFKLNLYPIAFNSTDSGLWQQHGFDSLTGFSSKSLFNNWCFFNRFPFFAELKQKHKPKLIICTGINYLTDFLMFFGGVKQVDRIYEAKLLANSPEKRTIYWTSLDGTLLVVLPFLSGRYGLNSNALLQAAGEKIATLYAEINTNR